MSACRYVYYMCIHLLRCEHTQKHVCYYEAAPPMFRACFASALCTGTRVEGCKPCLQITTIQGEWVDFQP